MSAVALDALTENAKNFYLRFGFREMLNDQFHLYLPIGTVIELGLTQP